MTLNTLLAKLNAVLSMKRLCRETSPFREAWLLTLIRGPNSRQDTPPNARAISTSLPSGPRTLIGSLMEMLPSSQGKWRNRRLREARDLAVENESLLSEEDRTVVEEGIAL